MREPIGVRVLDYDYALGAQAPGAFLHVDFDLVPWAGADPWGDPKCRAYRLTVKEFVGVGGVQWTHSFRIRIGLLARKLYVELFGKVPDAVRLRKTVGK